MEAALAAHFDLKRFHAKAASWPAETVNREIPMLNVVLIVTPRIKKTRPAIKHARPALICNKNHLTENKYTITLNPISRKQPILNLETSSSASNPCMVWPPNDTTLFRNWNLGENITHPTSLPPKKGERGKKRTSPPFQPGWKGLGQ